MRNMQQIVSCLSMLLPNRRGGKCFLQPRGNKSCISKGPTYHGHIIRNVEKIRLISLSYLSWIRRRYPFDTLENPKLSPNIKGKDGQICLIKQ